MAKKPYHRNNQNRPNESRSGMISISCEKYKELLKAHTEVSIIRQYLRDSTTAYAESETVRMILGIKKEA